MEATARPAKAVRDMTADEIAVARKTLPSWRVYGSRESRVRPGERINSDHEEFCIVRALLAAESCGDSWSYLGFYDPAIRQDPPVLALPRAFVLAVSDISREVLSGNEIGKDGLVELASVAFYREGMSRDGLRHAFSLAVDQISEAKGSGQI